MQPRQTKFDQFIGIVKKFEMFDPNPDKFRFDLDQLKSMLPKLSDKQYLIFLRIAYVKMVLDAFPSVENSLEPNMSEEWKLAEWEVIKKEFQKRLKTQSLVTWRWFIDSLSVHHKCCQRLCRYSKPYRPLPKNKFKFYFWLITRGSPGKKHLFKTQVALRRVLVSDIL